MVLVAELQALCLNIRVLDADKNVIEIPELDPEDTVSNEPQIHDDEPAFEPAPEEIVVPTDDFDDAVEKEYTQDDFSIDDEDDEVDPNSLDLDLDDDQDGPTL